MRKRDSEILAELKRRIPDELRGQIRRFLLFGSRARGRGREDSDLDLVILVDERTAEIERKLDDTAYSVMWDYDFKPIISLKIFSEAQFRKAADQGFSFYRHVEREGIPL